LRADISAATPKAINKIAMRKKSRSMNRVPV
jgi:hypothetical protein